MSPAPSHGQPPPGGVTRGQVRDQTVTQTGDSDPGNLKVLNNYKVNSGTEQVRNGASVAAIPYSYTPQANNTVKATVTAGAGTGKI